ncbi:transcription factor ces-2-like [Watersipora subatra]|uniref:transcription factor ces-2-like n=1 Tax=Watersipora subatra TaxID=2589382 RepID=UPI00355B90CD
MDPTQFMLPMPSMIPPHLLHNMSIPTTCAPPAPPMPMDILGFWANGSSPTVARAIAATQNQKRPRSEKKPIPRDQKDNKYFERRKRNNQAAKKSRDARKAREDDIAIRATYLEKENAVLRAQTATLREEAHSLKQALIQKRRQSMIS